MNALKSIINLSQSVAFAPALTQGGGGNTSVKNGGEMFVKASGYRLDEVNETQGYVRVSHQPVKTFLQKKTSELKQPDGELKQLVHDHIIGDKTYLPSMETGFHAVLKDYVIHTHPVVVNQILCTENGEADIRKIFTGEKIDVLPILNPGYYLSKAIADINEIPPVLFLQNHGLIVHSDNEREAIDLHGMVIRKINGALDFENDYNFELIEISANLFELKSKMSLTYFSQQRLLSSTYFPDQAVVIGHDYQFSESSVYLKKLNFNTAEKRCIINGNHKNALAISENLVALANIAAYAKQKKQHLNPLKDEDVAYILGMDMEKYRQGLLH